MSECESSQYDRVCKDEFAELKGMITGLRERLYVDNGAESIQSRLNRHERYIRAMAWVCATAASASVATLIAMAIKAIWHSGAG